MIPATSDVNRKLFIIGYIIIFSLTGCSRSSSIEGRVTSILSTRPISGVTVYATTKTNIMEEQPWSTISYTTDANGNFYLKGLKSGKSYSILLNHEDWIGNIASVRAPREDAELLRESLMAIPKPAKRGDWFYYKDDVEEPINLSEYLNPSKAKIYNNLLHPGKTFFPAVHFSYSDMKTNSITIPRKGVIVCSGCNNSSIGKLSHISKKVLLGLGEPATIDAGYYWNIQDIVKERGYVKPIYSDSMYFTHDIFDTRAILISAIDPGNYLLATELNTTGQGYTYPSSGLIFTVKY